MISKLPVTYPALLFRPADGAGSRRAVPANSGTGMRVGWVQQAVKVLAATLIEAIVILGFVVLSLGIGGEGHAGMGPELSSHLVAPAPAPPPDPGPIGR